jgi:hypothetical protein
MSENPLGCDALQRRPEDKANMATCPEAVTLRAALAEAEEDLKSGRLLSHAAVAAHLQNWLVP